MVLACLSFCPLVIAQKRSVTTMFCMRTSFIFIALKTSPRPLPERTSDGRAQGRAGPEEGGGEKDRKEEADMKSKFRPNSRFHRSIYPTITAYLRLTLWVLGTP